MAAFSFQPNHNVSFDSIVMPKNTTTKMYNYLGVESNINNMNSTFPPQVFVHDAFLDSEFQESSCLDHNYNSNATAAAACSDNDPSVTKKQLTESNSSVVDMFEKGEQVTQRVNSMDKKRKNKYLPSLSSAQSSKDNEEERCKKQKKIKGFKKNEQEKKLKADKKVEPKAGVEPPTGYIHVRARRGQATDSHSLAERVRREKISVRMKILQSLVPGCEKVTGKALVLDEIINYVQSLQNQVEFLSMKLSSLNPLFFEFGMDLDAFTLDSERVNTMQSLSQCSPTQPISTTFTDSTTTTTLNTTSSTYSLLDDSSWLCFQHGKIPHATSLTQDYGSLVWDVLDQRQKLLNPFGYPTTCVPSINTFAIHIQLPYKHIDYMNLEIQDN